MSEFVLIALLLFSGTEDKEALRFRHSLEQGYDDSCGLQCLACFLSVYWHQEANEEALLREGWGGGDFRITLADINRALGRRGFVTAAFSLSFEDLRAAAASYSPLIAHLARPRGHFVLVLAADDERVVVADPASGCFSLRRGDFLAGWSGAVLAARLPGEGPDRTEVEAAIAEADGVARLLEATARRMAGGRR
jgi:predicted double-glycine peptidase